MIAHTLILSRKTPVSYDGYVHKNKSRHITELQITKRMQINKNQKPVNPPPSAAGFTHSGPGDEDLGKEQNNLDKTKTKTEYVIEVNMTLR
jgi:hypothetical protein